MSRFAGKIVAITGGCGGIGSTIARSFALEGATVVICDMAEARVAETVQRLTGEGFAAFGITLDVASEESWEAATKAILANAGRIDTLVNNAGINDRGTVMTTVIADWQRTLSVNLTGPLLGMRSVAPLMRQNGGGTIVNMCSLASLHGEDFAGYGASKWALRGLTKIAAMEFVGWNVRVNSVSPAVVETPLNAGQPYIRPMAEMTPMGRNARAEEVANTILFLAGDDSSFITGQDIAVDGGFTAGAAPKYARRLAKMI